MNINAQFTVPLDTLITKAKNKYKVDATNILRKLALDILAEIVKRNPVDTGRSRANWNLSIVQPDFTTTSSTIPSHVELTATSLKGLPKIYIANGLDYVRELEFGRSDQAPSGFIRLAVQSVVSKGV